MYYNGGKVPTIPIYGADFSVGEKADANIATSPYPANKARASCFPAQSVTGLLPDRMHSTVIRFADETGQPTIVAAPEKAALGRASVGEAFDRALAASC